MAPIPLVGIGIHGSTHGCCAEGRPARSCGPPRRGSPTVRHQSRRPDRDRRRLRRHPAHQGRGPLRLLRRDGEPQRVLRATPVPPMCYPPPPPLSFKRGTASPCPPRGGGAGRAPRPARGAGRGGRRGGPPRPRRPRGVRAGGGGRPRSRARPELLIVRGGGGG